VSPRRVLALVAAAELFSMAPWFSASAVAPALVAHWHLDSATTAWLTISVQLGFVAGALVSALLTLSDALSARRLIAVSAVIAAVATASVPLAPGPVAGIVLRFITGVALAGVYPPGMKLIAGWYREGRGTAIGVLVGALTLGSAGPHLVRWALPAEAWRAVMFTAAGLSVIGGLLVLLVPNDGPFAGRAPPFTWSAVPRLLRERALALANAGYLGHMWELYAMWTWIAVFIAASERAAGREPGSLPALLAFATIASGALGCWIGGRAADRYGRTLVTTVAMLLSGSCALAVGLLFGRPTVLLAGLLVIWGVTIVADSAQFSTAVSELAPSAFVGTALTMQTCLGFLLTCLTIYGLPIVANAIGWRWTMSVLAIGPAVGAWSMMVLRRRPEAARLANGRG
jgi:MFS family permease